MDPAEIRRRNFIKSFPHQTPVIMCYDAGDYDASLDKALEIADYKGFPERRKASEQLRASCAASASRPTSRPAASPQSAAVGSLGAGVGLWESAQVRFNPVGTVEVLTGSHSHGQGHETTFAQLVAEPPRHPLENVEIVHGDTDKVQFGMGTYGSRSGAVGMTAISKASTRSRREVEEDRRPRDGGLAEGHRVQGRQLPRQGHRQEEVDRRDGACRLCRRTSSRRRKSSRASRKAPSTTRRTSPSRPAATSARWRSTRATGVTEIVDWVAVDDFGKIINPMIVEGQVHGGIAQGVGQALLENGVYDAESGQLADRLLHGLLHAARRQPAVLHGSASPRPPARRIRWASRAAAKPAPSPRPGGHQRHHRRASASCRWTCRPRPRRSGALAQQHAQAAE
jgi:aerobic carbon-monoxide dehydrogenase large subunit